MRFTDLVQKAAAMAGIHIARLAKQPGHSVVGLAGRPIDLIIDVGANTGQFAREMRTRFPQAHIVSFEPLPIPYAELADWAQKDGYATALNLALGEADGTLAIHQHLDHSASSSMFASTDQGHGLFPHTAREALLDVPVRRLDNTLAQIGLAAGPNTLLKLDVQGFELAVLRGAPSTLRTTGALISEINIDPLYIGQAEFMEIAQLCYAAGLHYAGNYAQYPAPDGHVMFLDAVFLR